MDNADTMEVEHILTPGVLDDARNNAERDDDVMNEGAMEQLSLEPRTTTSETSTRETTPPGNGSSQTTDDSGEQEAGGTTRATSEPLFLPSVSTSAGPGTASGETTSRQPSVPTPMEEDPPPTTNNEENSLALTIAPVPSKPASIVDNEITMEENTEPSVEKKAVEQDMRRVPTPDYLKNTPRIPTPTEPSTALPLVPIDDDIPAKPAKPAKPLRTRTVPDDSWGRRDEAPTTGITPVIDADAWGVSDPAATDSSQPSNAANPTLSSASWPSDNPTTNNTTDAVLTTTDSAPATASKDSGWPRWDSTPLDKTDNNGGGFGNSSGRPFGTGANAGAGAGGSGWASRGGRGGVGSGFGGGGGGFQHRDRDRDRGRPSSFGDGFASRENNEREVGSRHARFGSGGNGNGNGNGNVEGLLPPLGKSPVKSGGSRYAPYPPTGGSGSGRPGRGPGDVQTRTGMGMGIGSGSHLDAAEDTNEGLDYNGDDSGTGGGGGAVVLSQTPIFMSHHPGAVDILANIMNGAEVSAFKKDVMNHVKTFQELQENLASAYVSKQKWWDHYQHTKYSLEARLSASPSPTKKAQLLAEREAQRSRGIVDQDVYDRSVQIAEERLRSEVDAFVTRVGECLVDRVQKCLAEVVRGMSMGPVAGGAGGAGGELLAGVVERCLLMATPRLVREQVGNQERAQKKLEKRVVELESAIKDKDRRLADMEERLKLLERRFEGEPSNSSGTTMMMATDPSTSSSSEHEVQEETGYNPFWARLAAPFVLGSMKG